MDKTRTPFPAEDPQGVFAPRPLPHALAARCAAPPAAQGSPPASRLPPTRAARLARSRGVFSAGSWHARLGHWLRHSVCIAVAALALVASAHIALPASDAAAAHGNAGPELLASATSAPSFLNRTAR